MNKRPKNRPGTVDRVLAFFNDIGIPARYEPGATAFTEGVRIECGELLVDPACRISVLLHEGAHLAITPKRFRHLMCGNLYAGRREMFRQVGELGLPPDTPLYRAVIQSSDPEATAWAFAAGLHLGFSREEIIEDDQYDGDGETIRLALFLRSYSGINGLAHAGFCALRPGHQLPVWPELAFWTQEVDAEGYRDR
ncbi:hypothetical protein [Paraburkholderia aromaticivorans]|uniref:Uncharacterized protein n=1 Tax=Paraburkholderia aromaticivorans TaxID=2026199 RepID=A0A248VXE1_9BURK|nr:hypothetical protein [Paraburkholderia aromaticivorans]ASW03637.1 hypothetical protein CJU94_36140 [Paraburkholderia aromaticivorans]